MPDADAATLVATKVDEHAQSLGVDGLHGRVELHAAVAAQRVEHVAREALGVHAHEHVALALDRATHHRDVLLAVEHRLVHVRGEVAPRRRDARLGDPTDELLVLAAVLDELGDRDHQEPVLLAELDQVRDPRHRPVVVHDLAEHAGGVHARQTGQVHRRLGVAGALEHATLGVAQREDVAGPCQVARLRGGVDQRPDGRRAVRRRDAGRGAVHVVHRVGERRAVRLGVVADHQRDVELVEPLPRQRRADHARGVAHEERDGLGRRRLGRHDEVALVLAVLVVDHDDDLAAGHGGHGVLDRGEDGVLLALLVQRFAAHGATAPRVSAGVDPAAGR